MIILGMGLILTHKLWIPSLVNAILKQEEISQSVDGKEDVVSDDPKITYSNMDDWGWTLSEISPQGTQFMYPSVLPTKFVTAQTWPPTVEMTAGEFVCTEGEATLSDGSSKYFERRTIAGSAYCVGTSSEGAAGSTYTSYEYSTAQGDFLTRVIFTLREVQCLNYDEPEQSSCKSEQANFDPNDLADRIVSSLRMQ